MLTPDESGWLCVLTLLLVLLAYWAVIFIWGWVVGPKPSEGESSGGET